MKLSSLFARNKFVVTGEVGPPKGASADDVIEGALIMTDVLDAVNVTDNQSANMRMGSLAASYLIKQQGIEPVFQLACRDRNRIALQSDILSAAAFGIENILFITGDHMFMGDHPEAKKVFDLDSVQLLAAAKSLNDGRDMAGHELETSPSLCLGAVVNPGSDEVETQLIKMEKKIAAGAEFFQTQAVYDPATFAAFMERANKFGVPVMVGIVPLKSASMARYMNEHVAGVRVPDAVVKRMGEAKRQDRKKVSVEIAADFLRSVRDLCQGAHIMPLGWDDIVPKITRASGIRH